jgi:putative DNA primase/helicase
LALVTAAADHRHARRALSARGARLRRAIATDTGLLATRPDKPHPALIGTFVLVDEPEPGILGEPDGVEAVHLTLLAPDGSGKADVAPNKMVIASPRGMPLILAPMNDLMGLAITEGVEDALSVHQATGLGAWAAGSAPFMPKLVTAIEHLATAREYDASPDCITIFVDDDDAGRRHAQELAAGLAALSAKLSPTRSHGHFEIRLREAAP